MEAKRYKALRKEYNKDLLEEKKKQGYEVAKRMFKEYAQKFMLEDNLFLLLQAMVMGTEILKKQGFPIEEFKNYNKHGKRKQ